MAVTTAGQTLTEAHRSSQAKQAALVALTVQRLWAQMVDEQNLAETAAAWVDRVVPIILGAFRTSSRMASTYTQTLRRLEVPELRPFVPTPVQLVPEEAIRTSLFVTGPVALEKKLVKISGMDISPTLEKALVKEAVTEAGEQAGGAAVRHATNGGREQVKQAIREDRRQNPSRVALGWLRVPQADCCYFCAMLASRGKVYSEDSFDLSNDLFSGNGVSKAHDNCACALEPVYSKDDPGLARAKQWEQLWTTSTKGQSGEDAIYAFRRAYEGRSGGRQLRR